MSTQTAVAIRDDQTEFDDKQVALLRSLGVEKAGRADLALFFHVAKRTGLDPFARQIHMIERWTKDGPKQTIQVGIDGFRLVAQRTIERTSGTLGYEDTEWADSSGEWHDVWVSSEPPAAARVVVVRDGERFPGIAIWSEYAQRTKRGDLTSMWKTRPAGQLAKCAEALALRKAFPQDLSGIYTSDEIRDEHPTQQPQATVTAADFAPRAEHVDTTTGEVTDAEVVDEQTEFEQEAQS